VLADDRLLTHDDALTALHADVTASATALAIVIIYYAVTGCCCVHMLLCRL
jgi:hypothetical protein